MSAKQEGAGDARAEFEAWAFGRGWSLSPRQNNCGIVVEGGYGHPSVQRCWESWQAALATRQPVGQGPAMWASSARLAECAAQRLEPAPQWDMPKDGWPNGVAPLTQRNIAGASVRTELCDTPLYLAPPAQAVSVWKPIETAPKDNKRPLYIAQFNRDTGELIELDWDASWEKESESWEIPAEYYVWYSANGRVEEPTHWAYQDEPLPPAQEVRHG